MRKGSVFLMDSTNTFLPAYMVSKVKEIWPEPYSKFAAEAMTGDWPSGEVKLIVFWDALFKCYRDDGITGYFFDPEAPEDIYLRWTGILPSQQGKGIVTHAMDWLIQDIRIKFPERKRLIELVADNAYGTDVALPFFLKYGFVRDEVFVPPAEKSDWDCIPYVYHL